MNSDEKPVVVEQSFSNSVEEVWDAITNIEKMRQWYFDNIPSFKPEVGFETEFNVKSETRDFLHLWKVIDVVYLKKIVYNWKYENYPGDSFVTFELLKKENKTFLRLTHRVEESFPENIPEFKRKSCHAGWTYFINNSLKVFLDGDK